MHSDQMSVKNNTLRSGICENLCDQIRDFGELMYSDQGSVITNAIGLGICENL